MAWTFNEAKDQWVAAPLVVDDKVFAVNSDGNLYVLDLQDGQSTKRRRSNFVSAGVFGHNPPQTVSAFSDIA